MKLVTLNLDDSPVTVYSIPCVGMRKALREDPYVRIALTDRKVTKDWLPHHHELVQGRSFKLKIVEQMQTFEDMVYGPCARLWALD